MDIRRTFTITYEFLFSKERWKIYSKSTFIEFIFIDLTFSH